MKQIALKDNDIHLWITHPKSITDQNLLSAYDKLMTTEERARQQRFKFAKHQHDALVTRAFVRTVLSHYVDRKPEDWRFNKGEHDKPEIIDPDLALRFNLSHTENFIVCAIALTHDIGVDVEWVERQSDTLSIADRFFAPSEISELFGLPENAQQSRFFDYWTLKESYIKACGQGLAIPLDHFSFMINPSTNATINPNIQLSFAKQRNDNPDHWQSWLLYPNQDHRLALSIRDCNKTHYELSFFHTTPLKQYERINLPLSESARTAETPSDITNP
jgi:4'-phosphopantetheinyl transferase